MAFVAVSAVAATADLIPVGTFQNRIFEPGVELGDINLDGLHGVLFTIIIESNIGHKWEAGGDGHGCIVRKGTNRTIGGPIKWPVGGSAYSLKRANLVVRELV